MSAWGVAAFMAMSAVSWFMTGVSVVDQRHPDSKWGWVVTFAIYATFTGFIGLYFFRMLPQ